MTEPANDVSNSRREIPAEHVELMQQIQRLALRSGQLMQRMYESGGDAASATEAITRINALDRERDLTEIKARAAGVPAEWIDRVRTLGQRGFEWREDQPLPDPAPQGRRRTVQRVADDIERLKDMAAVHTAYQHTRGPGDTETGMETVVAQQLHRNMEAVWMRAGRAAHAIGMDAGERAALWSVTSAEWQRRVDHYLGGRDIADLHTRWRKYGDVTVAAEARKSLAKMRRAGQHGPDVPLPDMPMSPTRMLLEAGTSIAIQPAPQGADGDPITTAIDAALSDGTSTTWHEDAAPLPGADLYSAAPGVDSQIHP
ncbi:MAG: hypothetical protein JWN03_4297 [Nocardia sp.]|uniref:hypothetical protein n=1 Tax=Nocardia sp. TaxID=1821 RepID=UPI0026258AC5|nr:hypothetical protein [Nocardia sp.]MCU1644022.1 hypothetical protein [Nocardia sp.]